MPYRENSRRMRECWTNFLLVESKVRNVLVKRLWVTVLKIYFVRLPSQYQEKDVETCQGKGVGICQECSPPKSKCKAPHHKWFEPSECRDTPNCSASYSTVGRGVQRTSVGKTCHKGAAADKQIMAGKVATTRGVALRKSGGKTTSHHKARAAA